MIIQIEQLNELMQKKIQTELKDRNLTPADVSVSVEGAKISVTILATNEVINY